MNHDRFGFSTGALEKGDYRTAIAWMRQHHMRNVELSALRLEELEPLINDLDTLPLQDFAYVSFHAPSSFTKDSEERVVGLLNYVFHRGWNIVAHPDVIYTPSRWRHFGKQLLIENMDRRKTTGRTVAELCGLLHKLPEARVCLDLAHARQLDTTLTLLWHLTTSFKDRIAEVHISELDSRCRHLPLSKSAIVDYKQCAARLYGIPVIIESMLDEHHSGLREQEVRLARASMTTPQTDPPPRCEPAPAPPGSPAIPRHVPSLPP
jgi:hypothetical protein